MIIMYVHKTFTRETQKLLMKRMLPTGIKIQRLLKKIKYCMHNAVPILFDRNSINRKLTYKLLNKTHI